MDAKKIEAMVRQAGKTIQVCDMDTHVFNIVELADNKWLTWLARKDHHLVEWVSVEIPGTRQPLKTSEQVGQVLGM